MRKSIVLLILLIFASSNAQQPQKLNAAEIYKEIQKLNFLGSVLYIAAHPDDENTRLLSYLSNELHARTAYLSVTRGDGGQNLIGPELGKLLGIIRTQELLAARRIDNGHQFFTRAKDFGYSKHPEETLEIWNKDEVLKDFVRTIRKFKPDVIINRFDHTTAGTTHGHHTASAILGVEAYNLSGESSTFPDQLEELSKWSPKKLFFNTSSYFYENREEFENDKKNFIAFDTGVYFPLLGLSNTEISSLSRSQHQSQGFGSTGSRGTVKEYLQLIKGEHNSESNRLFEGINTTWTRIEGGKAIGELLTKVENEYDFLNPSASLPDLVKAYTLLQQLEDGHWKLIKTEEIKEIIAACAGLYLEAIADAPTAVPGTEIIIYLEAINRSESPVELTSIEIAPMGEKLEINEALPNNFSWQTEHRIKLPENTAYTTPYWLKESGTLGMYNVDKPSLIGLPETPKAIKAEFTVNINGVNVPFERTIPYKRNDVVKGETYQPFEIIPEVSASLPDKVVIFADDSPKTFPVTVKSSKASLEGTLRLKGTENWQITPEFHKVNFTEKGETQTFFFTVKPPASQSEATLHPEVEINGEVYSKEIVSIAYEHIPVQTVLLPAETKVVKLNLKKEGEHIGYIPGAGDEVPQSLEQIGYRVTSIAPQEITASNLEQFDAVVMGIRAYNTVPELRHKQHELFAYVQNGGNLIVQYNTSHALVTETLAPLSLKLSRDRVTDENAEVNILVPEHQVINFPNKITSNDFEGWVQERGLYFPNEWAEEFTPILSMNDPGEQPKRGSLLIAPFGKGHYIYTGLSFFRELPAGVPGAYKLFANMVSLQSEGAERKPVNSN